MLATASFRVGGIASCRLEEFLLSFGGRCRAVLLLVLAMGQLGCR
jgi:hypothetical protein